MRAALLLALAACLSPPDGWQILNATPEQEAQAFDLLAATRAVTGAAMPRGVIRIETEPYGLDGKCGVTTAHVSGCSYSPESIVVLVMPPLLGPDLLSTALPEELCHAALLSVSDDEAGKCAARVLR
jgi:hypothetical protein